MQQKTVTSPSPSFRPKMKTLFRFLSVFWFAPQDVLLRSIEATIFETVTLKHPILDIGIGDASISDLFYPKKLIIEQGVDVDAQGIARAKGAKKYKKIACDNAEHLHIPSEKFATVICNSTAEHIVNDKKAMQEIGRVLKKKGELHLTVPSSYLPDMIRALEQSEGNSDSQAALNRFNERVAHRHYHTLAEWTSILKKAHLEIVFYKFYFPEYVAQSWYRLMKWSTTQVFGREIWSWLGDSRLTFLVPKNLVIWYWVRVRLQPLFQKGFDTPDKKGGMLYIIARKQ